MSSCPTRAGLTVQQRLLRRSDGDVVRAGPLRGVRNRERVGGEALSENSDGETPVLRGNGGAKTYDARAKHEHGHRRCEGSNEIARPFAPTRLR